MQAIPVKYNQTNLDLALMAFGTIERVFELPNLQSQSLTDDLTAGDVLAIDGAADFEFRNIAVVLNRKEFIPASKKDLSETLQLEGVDYWSIGDEFIIE